MTRPDVDHTLRARLHGPEFCDCSQCADLRAAYNYIRALEAAREEVLPSVGAMGINTRVVALRRKFDAAVAGWAP